jgi:hypothetical protein
MGPLHLNPLRDVKAFRQNPATVCQAMPRYFFDMIAGDSERLVQDREGIVLPSAAEARNEAVGLARDILGHDISKAWRVVVRDAEGEEVLTVQLTEIHGRTWYARHIGRRLWKFKSKFYSKRNSVWVFVAMFATVQLAVTGWNFARPNGAYKIASAPTESTIVAVRFAPQATIADITKFLDAYKVSFTSGPGPGAFYRLRVADTVLPPDELVNFVARIAQEKVVETAAPVH